MSRHGCWRLCTRQMPRSRAGRNQRLERLSGRTMWDRHIRTQATRAASHLFRASSRILHAKNICACTSTANIGHPCRLSTRIHAHYSTRDEGKAEGGRTEGKHYGRGLASSGRGVLDEECAAYYAAIPRVDEDGDREGKGAQERCPS